MANRNPAKNSPVEGKVVEIPHYLQGFIHSQLFTAVFRHHNWYRISAIDMETEHPQSYSDSIELLSPKAALSNLNAWSLHSLLHLHFHHLSHPTVPEIITFLGTFPILYMFWNLKPSHPSWSQTFPPNTFNFNNS